MYQYTLILDYIPNIMVLYGVNKYLNKLIKSHREYRIWRQIPRVNNINVAYGIYTIGIPKMVSLLPRSRDILLMGIDEMILSRNYELLVHHLRIVTGETLISDYCLFARNILISMPPKVLKMMGCVLDHIDANLIIRCFDSISDMINLDNICPFVVEVYDHEHLHKCIEHILRLYIESAINSNNVAEMFRIACKMKLKYYAIALFDSITDIFSSTKLDKYTPFFTKSVVLCDSYDLYIKARRYVDFTSVSDDDLSYDITNIKLLEAILNVTNIPQRAIADKPAKTKTVMPRTNVSYVDIIGGIVVKHDEANLIDLHTMLEYSEYHGTYGIRYERTYDDIAYHCMFCYVCKSNCSRIIHDTLKNMKPTKNCHYAYHTALKLSMVDLLIDMDKYYKIRLTDYIDTCDIYTNALTAAIKHDDIRMANYIRNKHSIAINVYNARQFIRDIKETVINRPLRSWLWCMALTTITCSVSTIVPMVLYVTYKNIPYSTPIDLLGYTVTIRIFMIILLCTQLLSIVFIRLNI